MRSIRPTAAAARIARRCRARKLFTTAKAGAITASIFRNSALTNPTTADATSASTTDFRSASISEPSHDRSPDPSCRRAVDCRRDLVGGQRHRAIDPSSRAVCADHPGAADSDPRTGADLLRAAAAVAHRHAGTGDPALWLGLFDPGSDDAMTD